MAYTYKVRLRLYCSMAANRVSNIEAGYGRLIGKRENLPSRPEDDRQDLEFRPLVN